MAETQEKPGHRGSESASRPLRLSLRTLRAYQVCDAWSGPLIYLILITGPWLFGSTREWTEWLVDYLCYALGALYAVKLAIRALTGYRNPRWDERAKPPGAETSATAAERRSLNRSLAVLTVLIVGYCLLGVINAGAAYVPETKLFDYFKFLAWLPHSYDRISSWFAFWNYLALAILFWALHDWIVGKTPAEERADRARFGDFSGVRGRLLPERMRRLLWLLAISGGLLAAEGIAQRAAGTRDLLFFFPPIYQLKRTSEEFGPYAYRANGAQYLNLVWPVVLAFWWILEREARGESRRRGRKFSFAPRNFVLIAAAVMAAGPIVATTRAGTTVDVVMMIVAAAILLSARSKDYRAAKFKIVAGLVLALGLGAAFGWKALANRVQNESLEIAESQRQYVYDVASQMARDHPWFGTGPGTFETLYWAYQASTEDVVFQNLHNDWLETVITFGWIGSTLIALAFCAVLIRWLVPGGIHGGFRLVSLIWLALAGCLAHARYDFPLQIHSILAVFLVLCAILFSLSRGSSR